MAAKTLNIEMDFNEPKYEFTGSWTGKDLRVIVATIRRAYFKYQQKVRKETMLTQNSDMQGE